MSPQIAGLDLSLTATGIATADGQVDVVHCAERGTQRLITLRHKILHLLGTPDLVVLEDQVHRSHAAAATGALHGAVRCALWDAQIPVMLVAPATVKRYGAGKGNATKVAMIIAARERLGYQGQDDNCADALWLRALGLDLLGWPEVKMPAIHRSALGKVELPAAAIALERGAA